MKWNLEQLIKMGSNAPLNVIKACKEEIKFFIEMCKRQDKERSLYELLEVYVERANIDLFYYAKMVYACWELINGY